jgi:hypothetical protein
VDDGPCHIVNHQHDDGLNLLLRVPGKILQCVILFGGKH